MTAASVRRITLRSLAYARRSSIWVAALVYLGTIALAYPELFRDPGGRVLAGSQVAALFIWEFWWFRLSLLTPALDPLLTKMLFFPVGTPIVVQTPLLTGAAAALQSFMSVYTAYNLLALLAYLGAGLSMYALAHAVSKNRPAALWAGFVYMLSPYMLTQQGLGHLNQAMTGFVPLVFLGLWRLWPHPTPRSVWIFFAGAAGATLVSTYFIFQVLMVGAPVFVYMLWIERHERPVGPETAWPLAAILVCMLLAALFYWPIFVHRKELIGGSEMSSLSLLSFVDFPAWHPWEWVQDLRRHTSGMVDRSLLADPHFQGRPEQALLARPENLMGFLTLSMPLLLAWGAVTNAFRRTRAWWGLAITGVVFSLGSWLQVAYVETALPLPYLFFEFMGPLASFRSPARMILLAWTAWAVLGAIAIAHGTRRWRPWRRMALVAVLMFVFSVEMGLTGLKRFVTPLKVGPAYKLLIEEPGEGAVLELPAGIRRSGDVSLNVQGHMLYQPLHRRPLVVGRPSRHTWDALSFCERTDFLYELTHPHAIGILQGAGSLRDRYRSVRRRGREILEKNGIRYVLLHRDDRFFSQDIRLRYEWFLRAVLGSPVETGDRDILLFRVY